MTFFVPVYRKRKKEGEKGRREERRKEKRERRKEAGWEHVEGEDGREDDMTIERMPSRSQGLPKTLFS